MRITPYQKFGTIFKIHSFIKKVFYISNIKLTSKILSFALVILGICLILTLFQLQILNDKNEKLINEKSKMKKTIDSLNNEIFVMELQLFRHERAEEIFIERYPSVGSQFNDIISDETE